VPRPVAPSSEYAKPTAADLRAAYGKTIPDVLAPGLSVVFCGINPGLYSAATGCHFARPGNRFWPALYRSGFTPRPMLPQEQFDLLAYKLGVTNLVDRATARAVIRARPAGITRSGSGRDDGQGAISSGQREELSPAELSEGGRRLARKMRRLRPQWLAVLGVSAYRTAFAERAAVIGEQARTIGPTRIWVLPNPSGVNAHYTLDRLVEQFADLRRAAIDRSVS
jgi:double-stranded uracil-DNA glycosylase